MSPSINPPFFSVCVPSWNAAAFIRKSVGSVLAQTWKDWELFIVDDCSEDETWSVVQEYSGMPRVKVLRNERNLGQNGNLNRCVQMVSGKWLVILAADDFLVPHALETIKREVDQRPAAMLWVQNHLNHGMGRLPRLVTVHHEVREYSAVEFAELLYLKGNIFGEISNFAVRRDALLKIAPPFLTGSQSVDQRCWINLALAVREGRIIYWPEALTHILEHEGSISSTHKRSGEDYLDFFRLPADLLDSGWRREVLLKQALRMIKCGIKFGGRLPSGHTLLPYQTAWRLFKRTLAGNP